MKIIKVGKIKKFILVLLLLLFTFVTAVEGVFADSTYIDGKGDSFVLGKGGSRMKLTSHDNVQVVIVGKLGDRYAAMLDYNNSHEKLNGKLFLVDNVVTGHSENEDGIGSCSWDGFDSSIINIEGASLGDMVYKFNLWPRNYMQIFWFDMREKFNSEPDIWAVSCSGYSQNAFVFKYSEVIDEISNTVKKRTLTFKNGWGPFGHIVKGIDILDINSQISNPDPNERRCPPIFVEVSRPNGDNGPNNDWWGISSHIIFHNIEKNNKGVPVGVGAFGSYSCDYKPIPSYKVNYFLDIKRGETKRWKGICGGGISGLGTYRDNGEPTYTYYIMETEGEFKNWKGKGGDDYYFNSCIRSRPYTFEYDKQTNRFTKVNGGTSYANHSYSKGGKSSEMKKYLDNLYASCDSIFYHNRGPKVNLVAKNDLKIIGKGISGTNIRGGVKELFEKKGGGYDGFIGHLNIKDCEKRDLVEKEEYKDGKKGAALRRCDEEGRQVLGLFLGYPPTALHNGTSTGRETVVSVNYENVKTEGTETGSGVNAQWQVGAGYKSAVMPIEVHAGYQGYCNQMVKNNNGSTFSASIKKEKILKNESLDSCSRKGFIFFTNKLPILSYGDLVWENNKIAKIKGLKDDIIPISGGVKCNNQQISSNYFDLYNTSVTWNENEETYSAMTDGLENKDENFNNGGGNLFKYKNEAELKKNVTDAADANYRMLEKLKELANANVKQEKDTFKDRPVKWLVPSSPDMFFGYGWNDGSTFQMDFSKFENKDDVLEQGHGGYWKFSVFGPESEGKVTAQSTSRTYSNDTTKNGFGFKTPSVDNLTNNYNLRYYGFNINTKAYKQVMLNEKGKVERPEFIPEYCWERDQSFALFVPEVLGCSEQASHL